MNTAQREPYIGAVVRFPMLAAQQGTIESWDRDKSCWVVELRSKPVNVYPSELAFNPAKGWWEFRAR